jgi:para-aminobenzoate synthetase component 2
VEGVQFHPESILTAGGHRMIANWLAACGQPEGLDLVAGAEASLQAQSGASIALRHAAGAFLQK